MIGKYHMNGMLKRLIEDINKKKIIDFKKNNLHLVGYSRPIKKLISKKELIKHIYTSKKIKEAIPYITSYYKRTWGFCMSYNDFLKFDNEYENLINLK